MIDPASAGKKKVRKATLPGGTQSDQKQVGGEQQIKPQKEMEEILKAVKRDDAGGKLKEDIMQAACVEEWNGIDQRGKTRGKNAIEDGAEWKLEDSGCTTVEQQIGAGAPENKKNTKGRVEFKTVKGEVYI